MESFYGGRKGDSFVIVKRFDCIDLTENDQYRYKEYAIDEQGAFLCPLIAKNGNNSKLYSWKTHALNGEKIVKNGVEYQFPHELAEGMVQLFSKGAETTDIVNYGEYVIIDTIAGYGSRGNFDNGKVYRRGMDIYNSLGGAEYVGQIVGPQGESPELFIDSYDTIVQDIHSVKNEYTIENRDIIAGSYINENGSREYNDNIKYTSLTLKDKFDNIIGCKIGFKIPTLVTKFNGYSVSPYYDQEVNDLGETIHKNLITPNSYEYIDNQWQHPFFQEWDIAIPKGVQGDSVVSVSIEPTIIPNQSNKSDYRGYIPNKYTDSSCNNIITEAIARQDGYIISDNLLFKDEYENYTDYYGNSIDSNVQNVIPLKLVEEATGDISKKTLYVKIEDCFKYVMRCKVANYKTEIPTYEYYNVKDYSTIKDISVAENGTLTVYTTGEKGKYEFEKVLRSLDKVNAINISDEGIITIKYNDETVEELNTIVTWFTDLSINHDGIISYTKNTGEIHNLNSQLKWIDTISFDENKNLNINYNTGEVENFNNSNPLNAIIESVISQKSAYNPNAEYGHLLVQFSSKAIRDKYGEQPVWVQQYLTNNVKQYDWVDLGNVVGPQGGLKILTYYDNGIGSVNGIAPEDILIDGNANPAYAGWSVAAKLNNKVHLYGFDYNVKNWFDLGEIADSNNVNPNTIVTIGNNKVDTRLIQQQTTTNTLNNNGIWLSKYSDTIAGNGGNVEVIRGLLQKGNNTIYNIGTRPEYISEMRGFTGYINNFDEQYILGGPTIITETTDDKQNTWVNTEYRYESLQSDYYWTKTVLVKDQLSQSNIDIAFDNDTFVDNLTIDEIDNDTIVFNNSANITIENNTDITFFPTVDNYIEYTKLYYRSNNNTDIAVITKAVKTKIDNNGVKTIINTFYNHLKNTGDVNIQNVTVNGIVL